MPRTFFAPAHPGCILSRGGAKVDSAVLHGTEGTFAGTIAWFQMDRAARGRARLGREPTAAEVAATILTASHYVTGRDGAIAQMVQDDRKCYHASGYNSRSIGIEMETRLDPWPVRLSRDGTVKAPPFPAGEFTEALLRSTAKVVAVMSKKFGFPLDRQHVLGHYEVPGATHRDPGALIFDWDHFMAMASDERDALG